MVELQQTDGAGAERGARATAWALGGLGIALVGLIDYASGVELRVYPLYFGPVGLLAWYAGRTGAALGAVGGATAWLLCNLWAGLHFTTAALWFANTSVHALSFLAVGWLIASLRAALLATRELTRIDPLTSLRNRRAFHEDTAALLALCQRAGRAVTVAYIDLDHFKRVNDRHGHQAGDALLREVASAIRRSVRPSDVTARLGGDEFAILLPELGPEEAGTTLERVRAAVNAAAGAESGVTASVGGVTFLSAPLTMEALLQRADQLMYAAKATGRNAVSHEMVRSPVAADEAPRPASSRETSPSIADS